MTNFSPIFLVTKYSYIVSNFTNYHLEQLQFTCKPLVLCFIININYCSSHKKSGINMETTSKITQKWMLCAFGSFISCFIFLLYLKHNNEAVNFRALRHAMFNMASSLDDSFSPHGNLEISKPARRREDEGDIIQKNSRNKCNIFEGRWIYQSTESPYYEASQCPFLSEQVSCQKNGRPDFDYENWSWEAHDCVIPR